MSGSLLVIAPHPDDEILGAGGIMVRATRRGDRVSVVVATDGRASDPASDPDALADRRRGECRDGLIALLGFEPPTLFLDEPDGALASTGVDLSAGGRLATFSRAAAPDTVIVTDPADGHPDHRAAFGIATRLLSAGFGRKLLVMPVSQRVDGVFDPQRYAARPVAPFVDRKAAALARHASQIGQASGFSLAADVRRSFCDVEFTRVAYDRDHSKDDAVPAAHFDEMFKRSADPWRYDDAPYERDRFRRTIAALDSRRHASALELGCANGALTEHLAPLCERLLATDASTAALGAARHRLAAHTNVSLETRSMPDEVPPGPFDLIVASDLLYYLGLDGVVALMARLDRSASPNCRLLTASYLGETDTRLTGEMSSEAAIAHLPGWRVVHAERTDRLRIDVLERR